MSDLIFIMDFGVAAGLTLRARQYDDSGSQVGSEITTGFVEVDSTNAPGVYLYKLTTTTAGVLVVYENGNVYNRVALEVRPEEVIADAVLERDVSNTEDAAGTHSLTAIVLAALEAALSGTTLTIKKVDGATTFTTKTVTTDGAADPVTSIT